VPSLWRVACEEFLPAVIQVSQVQPLWQGGPLWQGLSYFEEGSGTTFITDSEPDSEPDSAEGGRRQASSYRKGLSND